MKTANGYCEHCEKITTHDYETELMYDDGADEPHTSNNLIEVGYYTCRQCEEINDNI